MAFVYAWIVPLWADQLLTQLLMEQFDTLPIQCRHIEHMHGGVYNFFRQYWKKIKKILNKVLNILENIMENGAFAPKEQMLHSP